MSEKHVFSLFSSQLLGDCRAGQSFSFQSDHLYRRIYTVLRLNDKEHVVLFDSKKQVAIELVGASKKGFIKGVVKKISAHKLLRPSIHLYVGLTKKDAFKDIVYYAAQMGAASITPVLSQKVQRRWGGEREEDRLRKIMIAACEQAKQFVMPNLLAPVSLQTISKSSQEVMVFFEAEGKPLRRLLEKEILRGHSYSLFIGPEGGFTQDEQKLLAQMGADCYRLTPSILRSQEAVMLSLGFLRSVTC